MIPELWGYWPRNSEPRLAAAHGLEEASDENVFDDYTYIPRVFLPKLQKEAGVTEKQVRIILEDNPQRVLTFRN